MKIVDKLLLKVKPVEIIRRSNYFDAEWYKNEYDIKSNPAEHYCNEGWKENYNPSDSFSTKDYLINNPDIQNINPLLHYEVFGKYEGRKPFIPPKGIINNYSVEDVSLVYEEYYKSIENKTTISFDVFDTLINRPFVEPKDLFVYMEYMYDSCDFAENRLLAEKKAREVFDKEVKLDDIYSCIPDQYRFLQEKEIELEIKLCHSNNLIRPIYEKVKKDNKRVIAISDMYHSKETIKRMLSETGYSLDEIYVSCEYNKTKGNGDLFKTVLELESVDNNEVVHFGDNYLSDYSQARLLNIDAYQTPKSIDFLLNNQKYQYCLSYLKKNNDLANSIHLSLVADYLNKNDDNFYSRLGYVFAGPLMLGYLNYVCNSAKKDSIDKLLFVSRDGYSLIEVYKRYFYQQYNIDYSYAYLSRAAIFSGNSKNKLCNDLRKFLEIIKLSVPELQIHDNNEENSIEYEKHQYTIDSVSCERSNNLRKHLEQVCKDKNNIATVDMVSGNFTSFKGAKFYLEDRLKKGYFAGSFASKNENLSFYCDRLLGMRDNLPVKFSELLISSPESPIVGVGDNGHALYEFDEENNRKERYVQIMSGVFEYCDDYFKLFNADDKLLLSFDKWLDFASCYLGECCDEDVSCLSNIVDSENPVSRNTDKSFKQLIEEYRKNGY